MPNLSRRIHFAAALIASALVPNAGAGVAFFDDTTDTIQVSGQTVFANAATYEAIMLFPSARSGGGAIVNEWQDFAEDKYFAIDGALLRIDRPAGTSATPISASAASERSSATDPPAADSSASSTCSA